MTAPFPRPSTAPYPSWPAPAPEPPCTRPGTTLFSSPEISTNPGPPHRSGYTRLSSSSALDVPGALGSSRLRPTSDEPRVLGVNPPSPRPRDPVLSTPRLGPSPHPTSISIPELPDRPAPMFKPPHSGSSTWVQVLVSPKKPKTQSPAPVGALFP